MIRGAKPVQLAVLNFLSVPVPPLHGDVAVAVGIDEHVEGAVAAQLGQEGDGRGDLAKDGCDFGLDLLLRLFRRGRSSPCSILLVGASSGRRRCHEDFLLFFCCCDQWSQWRRVGHRSERSAPFH